MVSNTRVIYKPKTIYSLLFSGDGYAVQFLGKYKIPYMYLSADDTMKTLCTKIHSKHISIKCKDYCQKLVDALTEYK